MSGGEHRPSEPATRAKTVKRLYGKDIGYAALGFGGLMVAAALMAIMVQSVMPKEALALPVRGLDWFFKHTVLLGSLQFAMGGCLVLAARAYLRGKPWG